MNKPTLMTKYSNKDGDIADMQDKLMETITNKNKKEFTILNKETQENEDNDINKTEENILKKEVQ